MAAQWLAAGKKAVCTAVVERIFQALERLRLVRLGAGKVGQGLPGLSGMAVWA